MERNNFYYAYNLLDTLYGVEMDENQFEEIGLIAWNLIGNKLTKLYKINLEVDSDGKVILPCNAYAVEAVTMCQEDYNNVSIKKNYNYDSLLTESYIEYRKTNKHPAYLSGKFVKYEEVGNVLYIKQSVKKVNVLYKGVILDEEGLPSLTDTEALAIATYCAFIHFNKQGLILRDKNTIEIAKSMENDWRIKCSQARVPVHLSQNDMDRILDAKTSWNRKLFGKSFKPFK